MGGEETWNKLVPNPQKENTMYNYITIGKDILTFEVSPEKLRISAPYQSFQSRVSVLGGEILKTSGCEN